jgi:hypothetical protein
MALPTVPVVVGSGHGTRVRALVDSGCSQTIISRTLVSEVSPSGSKVVAVDGSYLSCGTASVSLTVECRWSVQVDCRCSGDCSGVVPRVGEAFVRV